MGFLSQPSLQIIPAQPLNTTFHKSIHILWFSGPPGDASEVKRELIESCPDFPGDLDQEYLDEKEDLAKEEIKNILPKVIERKKTRRRPVKRKKEEDEDEDDKDEDGKDDDGKDWGETGRKRSSQKFHCPDINCEASFPKEVASKQKYGKDLTLF